MSHVCSRCPNCAPMQQQHQGAHAMYGWPMPNSSHPSNSVLGGHAHMLHSFSCTRDAHADLTRPTSERRAHTKSFRRALNDTKPRPHGVSACTACQSHAIARALMRIHFERKHVRRHLRRVLVPQVPPMMLLTSSRGRAARRWRVRHRAHDVDAALDHSAATSCR